MHIIIHKNFGKEFLFKKFAVEKILFDLPWFQVEVKVPSHLKTNTHWRPIQLKRKKVTIFIQLKLDAQKNWSLWAFSTLPSKFELHVRQETEVKSCCVTYIHDQVNFFVFIKFYEKYICSHLRNCSIIQETSYIDRVPHFHAQLKPYFSYQHTNMDTFDQSCKTSCQ